MQTLVYHVNTLLWMFRQKDRASQTETDKVRRTDSAVQMWEILFICFLCLSTDIETLWSYETALKSINTNPKTAATPRQPHKRLTFPGGRSCDPMTHVLSKIACFLQRRPHSVSNSTTYWLPREWTGTETARDGGLCPFNDPPLFSSPLPHSLYLLPLPPFLLPRNHCAIGSRNVCGSAPFGLSEWLCYDPAESIKFTQEFKPTSHKHRPRPLLTPLPQSSAHLRATSAK